MTATAEATGLSQYIGTWAIDASHSRLGFEARHAVVTKVRGSFTNFDGTIVVSDSLTDSAVSVTARLDSVDTGSADRDGHLKSADFFDVANTNDMTFTSTSIAPAADGFIVTGDLTIRGVTKPLTLDVELGGIATDPFGNVRAGFEGKGEISRKDFGLTWNVALEAGGVLVSDTIKLQLDISAIKQA
jgi:polyisoprenoid-binding protein YceI